MKFNLQAKHYWIAGLIGAVSLTGAYMYLQVRKILNYTLNFVSIKDLKYTNNVAKFNLIYNYENKANIDVVLAEQEYDVYINDVYYTTLRNYAPQKLFGGQKNIIAVAVVLDVKDIASKLKTNYLTLIALPQNVKILIKMKFKVKYGILKIPIKYEYPLTLKEIISWYLPNQSSNQQ
jgi:LEA14-like dessication related protein